MYTLHKSFSFEASHVLAEHAGKCARLHGHSYVVTLELEGALLGASGPGKNMLIDFCEVSRVMRGVLDKYLDHRHLNDTLQSDAPTAEFIARWIFERVRSELPCLVAVKVQETKSGSATYRRPPEPGERAWKGRGARENGEVQAVDCAWKGGEARENGEREPVEERGCRMNAEEAKLRMRAGRKGMECNGNGF